MGRLGLFEEGKVSFSKIRGIYRLFHDYFLESREVGVFFSFFISSGFINT